MFCKLREWVWTETGKCDRLGGRQKGRSEPAFRPACTTALPQEPPELDKRPASFTCRPVCDTAACAGLCRPCHALSACLCLDPMPASPCLRLPHSIHYHVRQDHRASCGDCPAGSPADHCVCLRRCPSSILQGLPCRQLHHGTALSSPCTVLCSLRSCQRGGLGLHWAAGHIPCRQLHTGAALVQPVCGLCSYLHLFHEPETAFGQPGSLPSFPQSPSVWGHG